MGMVREIANAVESDRAFWLRMELQDEMERARIDRLYGHYDDPSLPRYLPAESEAAILTSAVEASRQDGKRAG